MNHRKCLLGVFGVATVIVIALFFLKNNNVPFSSERLLENSSPEESTRTALNEIGQMLTKSYETIDCIDDKLNNLPEEQKSAQTILEKAAEVLAQTDAQLIAGESSLNNRLKTLSENIELLSTDNDTKTAFKETIEDFRNQQEKLIEYVQAVFEKITQAEEKLNIHASCEKAL